MDHEVYNSMCAEQLVKVAFWMGSVQFGVELWPFWPPHICAGSQGLLASHSSIDYDIMFKLPICTFFLTKPKEECEQCPVHVCVCWKVWICTIFFKMISFNFCYTYISMHCDQCRTVHCSALYWMSALYCADKNVHVFCIYVFVCLYVLVYLCICIITLNECNVLRR